MSKVSIIIPVYNVERYLKECLDSIVNQTLTDIEIICVNDGSTDGSLGILEKYASEDDRIKIINQENQGQGVARNNGLNLATGEFIGFVDPDDWIDESMYEKMYNSAIENDCDLVECLYNKHYDTTNVTKKVVLKNIKKYYNKAFSLKSDKEYLFMGHCAIVWNKLFKRELILKHNIAFENSKINEDGIVSFSGRMYANKLFLLPLHLYFYRQRECSARYKKSDEYFSLIGVINNFVSAVKVAGFYNEYKIELSNYIVRSLVENYSRIKDSSLLKYDEEVSKLLDKKEFEYYKRLKRDNRSFAERIFSIKNKEISGVLYKVITILGYSIMIKKDNNNAKG